MTVERTIVHDTTVVDVRDGGARRGVDITIEGGRIASITPCSDDHPDRVAVVDARGTYAVPGFCDMHAHPLAGQNDAGPALRLMLACGVTGFRQMNGSPALLGDRGNGRLRLPVDGPALLSTPGDVLLPFNASSEEVAMVTPGRLGRQDAIDRASRSRSRHRRGLLRSPRSHRARRRESAGADVSHRAAAAVR